MSDIPVSKKGKILSGKYEEWFIEVVPEGQNGYLVLYTDGETRESTLEGYDDWILREDLTKYFSEADFKIDWS